jgi:recombination protein RecT
MRYLKMTNQLQTVKAKPLTIKDFFLSKEEGNKFKQSLITALPKHITPDKMLRVMLTECRRNQKLFTCTRDSFLGCILQCSQVGLEPSGTLGHAYLIPFENKQKHITECTLIFGYRGFIELARRSGQILSICTRVVRESDKFIVSYGIDEHVEHVPSEDVKSPLKAVYCVVHFKDGGHHFELMYKPEIERIRLRAKTDKVWSVDYEEMARKTVVRRAAKYLPLSAEFQQAIHLDETADLGHQDLTIESDELPIEEADKPTATEKALEALGGETSEESKKMAEEFFGDEK